MSEKINIFISHKTEDEQTAMHVRKILKDFDDDETPMMEFSLSEEIPGGEKWYEWITSKLKSSNLLILLFTDPTLNWDWCLYEAGLFDLLDGDHHRRTICLHSPATDPPAPLKHLQAFSANTEGTTKFLDQLFLGTDLTGLQKPIAKWLNKVPEKKKKAAKEIAQLINRIPEKTEWHTKYMFIHVSDPRKLKEDHIPSDAKVMSTEKTFELFDRPDGAWTWKDIEEKVRLKDDQRWLDELAMSMKAVAEGNLPEPIQALFHPLRGSMLYRPILYRADKLADGSIKYKILFFEDVSWQVKEAPTNLRSLLTSLVMATRFRYELLQKFLDDNGNLINGTPRQDICQEIKHTIYSIESEASSRGLLDKLSLTRVFASAQDRQAISGMYDDWYAIREQLFDEAGQIRCETAEQELNKLMGMNTEFLLLAVDRFGALLEEEKAQMMGLEN
jgi:hypothetical protein